MNVVLPVKALRQGIKPVSREKLEFEDRDKSKLLAFLEILGLSKFRSTEQKKMVSEERAPVKK